MTQSQKQCSKKIPAYVERVFLEKSIYKYVGEEIIVLFAWLWR